MNNGWIRLYRKLLDHPRANDPDWMAIWVFLMLNATYEKSVVNRGGRKYQLVPGELVTSEPEIAKATGVHLSKVRRVLEWMRIEEQIERQAGNKSSIITLLNWSESQKSKDKTTGNRKTNERQNSIATNVDEPF